MGENIRYDLWQPDIESARAAKLNDKEFDENIENAKTSFGERKRLFGIAVHYYMSKIIYATAAEKSIARQMLYTKYGNILDESDIDKIVRITDTFIEECHYLFDSSKWDRVLTEQWFADKNGYLKRLDRIMFDTTHKQIKIVDYKTGAKDKKQLEEYKALIETLLGDDLKNWKILDPQDFFIREDEIVEIKTE